MSADDRKPQKKVGRGGWGVIIYVKILLKKSVCLVLALGWRENINKKKYIGDDVDCFFYNCVITCG